MTPWTFQPRSNPFGRLKIGARSAAAFTGNLLPSYWLWSDIPVVYQRKKPFISGFLNGFDGCRRTFVERSQSVQNRLLVERDLLGECSRRNTHHEYSIPHEFGVTHTRQGGVDHLGPELSDLFRWKER